MFIHAGELADVCGAPTNQIVDGGQPILQPSFLVIPKKHHQIHWLTAGKSTNVRDISSVDISAELKATGAAA